MGLDSVVVLIFYRNSCYLHGNCPLHFSAWRELSGELQGVDENTITKVDFSKEWKFADIETRNAYKELAENIQARNKHRDESMSFSEHFTIAGFQSSMRRH